MPPMAPPGAGTAIASATVSDGIAQTAVADAGNSLASLTNDGAINIHAIAYATGDASLRGSQRRHCAICRHLAAKARPGILAVHATAARTLFDRDHRQQRHDRRRRDRRCPRDGHARRPGDGNRQCLQRASASCALRRGQCAGQPDGHRLNRYRRNCQRRRRQWRGVRQRIHQVRSRSRRSRKVGTASDVLSQAAIDIHASLCERIDRRGRASATVASGIGQYASATRARAHQMANVSLVNAGTSASSPPRRRSRPT